MKFYTVFIAYMFRLLKVPFERMPLKTFCNETTLLLSLNCRQTGQDTVEEVRSRDFRKDLEERERQAVRDRAKEKGSRSTAEQPKRPRLDQPPPSNLDADDPVDDDDDDDSDERCHGLRFITLCLVLFHMF